MRMRKIASVEFRKGMYKINTSGATTPQIVALVASSEGLPGLTSCSSWKKESSGVIPCFFGNDCTAVMVQLLSIGDD